MSDSANKEGAETAPAHGERQALVDRYRAQAMALGSPLAANLGVITADLMGMVHGLASAVQRGLAQPGSVAERPRALQDVELYLRCIRQIDRLAQIQRQIAGNDGT